MLEFDMHRKFLAAARAGNMAKLEKYLARGVDVDYQNEVGESPLMAAAYQNHLAVVKRLVDAGADVHLVNSNGESAVSLASMAMNNEVIVLMRSNWKRKKTKRKTSVLDNAIAEYQSEWHGDAW